MGVACELKKKVIIFLLIGLFPCLDVPCEIIGLIEKKKGKSDFSFFINTGSFV